MESERARALASNQLTRRDTRNQVGPPSSGLTSIELSRHCLVAFTDLGATRVRSRGWGIEFCVNIR